MAEILLFLLYLCFAAIICYVFIWAVCSIFDPVPGRIVQLMYVAAVLILLYVAVINFPGSFSHFPRMIR